MVVKVVPRESTKNTLFTNTLFFSSPGLQRKFNRYGYYSNGCCHLGFDLFVFNGWAYLVVLAAAAEDTIFSGH